MTTKKQDPLLALVSLGLSRRSHKLLTERGINTVEQLMKFNEEQLKAIPRCGQVTCNEVRIALNNYGPSVKPDEQTPKRPSAKSASYQALHDMENDNSFPASQAYALTCKALHPTKGEEVRGLFDRILKAVHEGKFKLECPAPNHNYHVTSVLRAKGFRVSTKARGAVFVISWEKS